MQESFWQEFQWTEFSHILIANFALVPPPVIIPLFIGLVAGMGPLGKRRVAFVASVAYFVVMAVFIFFGMAILTAFGITLGAFRLAGGFLLLLIALDMLNAKPLAHQQPTDTHYEGSATALAIVPMAIPILAGPGAISSIVIFSSQADEQGIAHQILVLGVVATLTVYIYLTLLLAARSDKLIGPQTTYIFNKVMGLVIAAIAFEFMMDGIAEHFPGLESIH